MDTSDESLVSAYREGDEAALERLVKRHVDGVYGYLRRLSGDASEADDLTQEAFARAWKRLEQFDTEKKFKPWLYAIARNTLIDWSRKRKSIRFTQLDTEDSSFEETLEDPEPLPDELFARTELSKQLERALAILASDDRSIVLFHYVDGFTFDEIGQITQMSLNTVKSRYRRALLKLREELVHQNNGEPRIGK